MTPPLDIDRLHPLNDDTPRPHRMNNPMGYIPHPLCIHAAQEVQRLLATTAEWQDDIAKGKMFGVLVVETDDVRLGYLAAYSGLLAERNDWPFFVPAVFDFQQPDGYFKREEAIISDINRQIKEIDQSPIIAEKRARLTAMRHQKNDEIVRWKEQMRVAKQRREEYRQGVADNLQTDGQRPSEEEMTRESQWMKAELHRIRRRHDTAITQQEEKLKTLEQEVNALRALRRQKSEALQQWLFTHFIMLNSQGERRDLLQIFSDTTTPIPPSGTGECCAPKLLQYAFIHQLRPLCMAEFWWGQSPVSEVRHHLHYYPACRGKCLPILRHMLKGIETDDNPFEQTVEATPEILFEDEWLMVVSKPAGMLSVPGKVEGVSVWNFAKDHCPDADGPLLVHRLDMATSGLIVVAKTKNTHQKLQAQFNNRTIEKTYIALLQHPLPAGTPCSGIIDLPLRGDPTDRPRQVVDTTHGKPAVTYYEMLTDLKVRLSPKTGRTHQLRVHCAHAQGLGVPIKGDPLYGTPADRLYLHAETLVITHPHTGQRMTFTYEAPF